ncbi:unnamed protein product [Ilex paraguariensis]|uniref:Protein root UVB sensitive/RUS domain-containing protein n=1 Tax=Ilex paraguariensis TaxID=185542 RepID=A0ABC8SAU8_9AQUA
MALVAGMLMDIVSPLFPSAFVFVVCLGSLSRSFTGVASYATRAALTQHFALQNNAADISAKGVTEDITSFVSFAAHSLGPQDQAFRAGIACYDILVDVPFPIQKEFNALLANTEKTKEIDACDEATCTAIRKIHEHRNRWAFFLGFNQSPVEFINTLIESQGRDLKLTAGQASRSAEKEHRLNFYRQPCLSKGTSNTLRDIEMVQEDIWQYMRTFPSILFQAVIRKENQLAYLIASMTRNGSIPTQCAVNPPGRVILLVNKEARE